MLSRLLVQSFLHISLTEVDVFPLFWVNEYFPILK